MTTPTYRLIPRRKHEPVAHDWRDTALGIGVYVALVLATLWLQP